MVKDDRSIHCPNCEACKKQPAEFQKIGDTEGSGLCLYRYNQNTKRVQAVGTSINPASLEDICDNEVFILENTTDTIMTAVEIAPTIEKCKINCPRCRYIMKRAQKLMGNIPTVEGNFFKGICEHCQGKSKSGRPCSTCRNVVRQFINCKLKPTAEDVATNQIGSWLSKIKDALKDVDKESHSDLTLSEKLIKKEQPIHHEIPQLVPPIIAVKEKNEEPSHVKISELIPPIVAEEESSSLAESLAPKEKVTICKTVKVIPDIQYDHTTLDEDSDYHFKTYTGDEPTIVPGVRKKDFLGRKTMIPRDRSPDLLGTQTTKRNDQKANIFGTQTMIPSDRRTGFFETQTPKPNDQRIDIFGRQTMIPSDRKTDLHGTATPTTNDQRADILGTQTLIPSDRKTGFFETQTPKPNDQRVDIHGRQTMMPSDRKTGLHGTATPTTNDQRADILGTQTLIPSDRKTGFFGTQTPKPNDQRVDILGRQTMMTSNRKTGLHGTATPTTNDQRADILGTQTLIPSDQKTGFFGTQTPKPNDQRVDIHGRQTMMPSDRRTGSIGTASLTTNDQRADILGRQTMTPSDRRTGLFGTETPTINEQRADILGTHTLIPSDQKTGFFETQTPKPNDQRVDILGRQTMMPSDRRTGFLETQTLKPNDQRIDIFETQTMIPSDRKTGSLRTQTPKPYDQRTDILGRQTMIPSNQWNAELLGTTTVEASILKVPTQDGDQTSKIKPRPERESFQTHLSIGSLITSLLEAPEDFIRQDLEYFFPKIVKKDFNEEELGRKIRSSTELFQETLKRLEMEAKEKERKKEEIRKAKREQKEKKRLARLEKRRQERGLKEDEVSYVSMSVTSFSSGITKRRKSFSSPESFKSDQSLRKYKRKRHKADTYYGSEKDELDTGEGKHHRREHKRDISDEEYIKDKKLMRQKEVEDEGKKTDRDKSALSRKEQLAGIYKEVKYNKDNKSVIEKDTDRKSDKDKSVVHEKDKKSAMAKDAERRSERNKLEATDAQVLSKVKEGKYEEDKKIAPGKEKEGKLSASTKKLQVSGKDKERKYDEDKKSMADGKEPLVTGKDKDGKYYTHKKSATEKEKGGKSDKGTSMPFGKGPQASGDYEEGKYHKSGKFVPDKEKEEKPSKDKQRDPEKDGKFEKDKDSKIQRKKITEKEEEKPGKDKGVIAPGKGTLVKDKLSKSDKEIISTPRKVKDSTLDKDKVPAPGKSVPAPGKSEAEKDLQVIETEKTLKTDKATTMQSGKGPQVSGDYEKGKYNKDGKSAPGTEKQEKPLKDKQTKASSKDLKEPGKEKDDKFEKDKDLRVPGQKISEKEEEKPGKAVSLGKGKEGKSDKEIIPTPRKEKDAILDKDKAPGPRKSEKDKSLSVTEKETQATVIEKSGKSEKGSLAPEKETDRAKKSQYDEDKLLKVEKSTKTSTKGTQGPKKEPKTIQDKAMTGKETQSLGKQKGEKSDKEITPTPRRMKDPILDKDNATHQGKLDKDKVFSEIEPNVTVNVKASSVPDKVRAPKSQYDKDNLSKDEKGKTTKTAAKETQVPETEKVIKKDQGKGLTGKETHELAKQKGEKSEKEILPTPRRAKDDTIDKDKATLKGISDKDKALSEMGPKDTEKEKESSVPGKVLKDEKSKSTKKTTKKRQESDKDIGKEKREKSEYEISPTPRRVKDPLLDQDKAMFPGKSDKDKETEPKVTRKEKGTSAVGKMLEDEKGKPTKTTLKKTQVPETEKRTKTDQSKAFTEKEAQDLGKQKGEKLENEIVPTPRRAKDDIVDKDRATFPGKLDKDKALSEIESKETRKEKESSAPGKVLKDEKVKSTRTTTKKRQGSDKEIGKEKRETSEEILPTPRRVKDDIVDKDRATLPGKLDKDKALSEIESKETRKEKESSAPGKVLKDEKVKSIRTTTKKRQGSDKEIGKEKREKSEQEILPTPRRVKDPLLDQDKATFPGKSDKDKETTPKVTGKEKESSVAGKELEDEKGKATKTTSKKTQVPETEKRTKTDQGRAFAEKEAQELGKQKGEKIEKEILPTPRRVKDDIVDKDRATFPEKLDKDKPLSEKELKETVKEKESSAPGKVLKDEKGKTTKTTTKKRQGSDKEIGKEKREKSGQEILPTPRRVKDPLLDQDKATFPGKSDKDKETESKVTGKDKEFSVLGKDINKDKATKSQYNKDNMSRDDKDNSIKPTKTGTQVPPAKDIPVFRKGFPGAGKKEQEGEKLKTKGVTADGDELDDEMKDIPKTPKRKIEVGDEEVKKEKAGQMLAAFGKEVPISAKVVDVKGKPATGELGGQGGKTGIDMSMAIKDKAPGKVKYKGDKQIKQIGKEGEAEEDEKKITGKIKQKDSKQTEIKGKQGAKEAGSDKRDVQEEEKELVNPKQIKAQQSKHDDLISQLVKVRGDRREKTPTSIFIPPPPIIKKKIKKKHSVVPFSKSEMELDRESLQEGKLRVSDEPDELVYTDEIINKSDEPKRTILPKPPKQNIFIDTYKEDLLEYTVPLPIKQEPVISEPKVTEKIEQDGVIRYALSDRTFIEKGWTLLPVEKVVRKMNVYRMSPAHPEFDWFEHNKTKGVRYYDTGEKLAEFTENGRGKWFYKNGRLALDYYDAEEMCAQQRFVIYSNGEPDERGRSRPVTVLGIFDYIGNGVVFDHKGKVRLKYNQTEGVVLDRGIGPASHWKWHSLNDPPVLERVMIDNQMPFKDPKIQKLGKNLEKSPRPKDEEMLAIEFDNMIKEKSQKFSEKFKPFQIKMKALKINENFSLRVLDQATVYLIFRDGSTNLKLNLGMVLNSKEIIDTDIADVGEVSTSIDRHPAHTDSIACLQRSLEHTQKFETKQTEHDLRLRIPQPALSIDKFNTLVSKPLKPSLRPVHSVTSVCGENQCRSSRRPVCTMYYNNRLN